MDSVAIRPFYRTGGLGSTIGDFDNRPDRAGFMILRVTLGILVFSLGSVCAHAQALTAVHPLSGYKCMALNLSPEEMMTKLVPMLSNPNSTSQRIGYVAATVIASDQPPVNSYQKVIRFDGKEGWVAEQYLKPWVNPGGNGQKCIPSVMSNGSLGFQTD
jgi:hypothetical protein